MAFGTEYAYDVNGTSLGEYRKDKRNSRHNAEYHDFIYYT
jgi:hypothetical protein